MRRSMQWVGLVLASGLLGAPAAGDLVNGDFDDPNTPPPGWSSGTGGAVVVEDDPADSDGDDELCIDATATYTWDASAGAWDGSGAMDSAVQVASIPSGRDTLLFSAQSISLQAAGALDTVSIGVAVDYKDTNGSDLRVEQTWTPGSPGGTTLVLTDPDFTQPMTVSVLGQALGVPSDWDDGTQDGEQQVLHARGYFDDFQFVPEPASLTLVALGGAVLLRRRRRQSQRA
ncbi:MAG: PEP-CTERM sorting domain-containing protein [Planctomycetota bacterium]